jgi:hypothetical protein
VPACITISDKASGEKDAFTDGVLASCGGFRRVCGKVVGEVEKLCTVADCGGRSTVEMSDADS